MTDPKQVDELAAVLHPDAFDLRARNATGYAAQWFRGAATSAKEQAERAIAAGWVSPGEHRIEVERLTKSVGAFSAARDAAKKGWQEANDKVARVEALAEDLDKKSTAAYESRYTEDWAYHEGRGDAYEESERLIRAALAEPTEHQ